MLHRAITWFTALMLGTIFVLAIIWGMQTEGRSAVGLLPDPPATPAPGEVVELEMPAGSDGALGRCVVCHNVDRAGPARAAPDLAGIVGAPKARSPWFAYSKALRTAGGTWTETELDEYLTRPAAFLPGTSKTIVGIPDPAERQRIIEALAATAG